MNLETTDAADLLPAEAGERLQSIRRERDDASAIVRAVVTQMLEERSKRAVAKQRMDALMQTFRPLPEDHPSVAQARRSLDTINAEMARLSNRETTAAATFGHADRLAATIERWVQEHAAAGRGFAMAPAVEPRVLKTDSGVIDAIARNRREVRRLEADLHECRSAPISSAEAKIAVRKQVAALAARGRPFVEAATEHGAPITFAEISDMRASTVTLQKGDPQITVFWSQFDALATFAWVYEKALADRLAAEIDAIADDASALSPVDRRKRETELLGDIAMTQKQIAALIRLAETEGIEVTFDADTPPEIILGVVVVDAPQSAGLDRTEEVLRAHRAMIDAAEPVVATPAAP